MMDYTNEIELYDNLEDLQKSRNWDPEEFDDLRADNWLEDISIYVGDVSRPESLTPITLYDSKGLNKGHIEGTLLRYISEAEIEVPVVGIYEGQQVELDTYKQASPDDLLMNYAIMLDKSTNKLYLLND